jgi:PhzF family phenazine biosynthesis protein
MTIEIHQVDAFASEPFRGNPAAVCFPSPNASDAWLRSVAAEMNLSETAFLWPERGGWRLRWMTPVVEVDLCGHATLASAHVLWSTDKLAPDATARFYTRSGELTAKKIGDLIELDFPASPIEPSAPPPGMLEALGLQREPVYRTRFDYLVVLESEEKVRALRPDFAAMRTLGVRGVMVTAKSEQHDFVSRFFAPGSGIDEDPVTGSAHCALAPYWSRELDKTCMRAHQASARGGDLEVELIGDRVALRGHAITILSGQLLA